MKVADYLTAMCWCSRVEVEIPVSWVAAGQTKACDYPGCGPGCQMAPPEDEPDDPYDEVVEIPTRKWKMNKFSPARYDTKVDSTPGLPRRPDSVSLLIGEGLCACGCGETLTGRKARFRMGHDAKLKGKLTRAHAAQVTVSLVEESTGVADVLDPLEYADRFSTDKMDWRKYVTDSAAKVAERRGTIDRDAAQRRVMEKAASSDNVVKVGRWDKTDSVAVIYRVDGGHEVEYVDEQGRIRQQFVANQEAS